MVDVKTEERHAHEHEILLGKYENGSLRVTTFMFRKWPFHQHSFQNSLQLSVFQFLFLEKDIVTPTIKADNVSPLLLFNQKPYQLPVKLQQHKSIK